VVRVSSTEFQREVGRYTDMALSQPVTVTRNGRDRNVLISAEEYERLKRRDRQALYAEELSQEDLDAIALAEVPAEFAHLDSELDDHKP
jgi:prevent-host-death family protein